ncbi:MAG: prepilin-type N-terminal cleavage/methylation domain-containing protein [Fimbriimonadaceae bacterium]|nr:prepilin-type N-terminal cleavage/methylation domain-containing protein [Fimbriimonadaceae bacterium]
MHYKKAFTLIELLVVIAIIAILAAILFPVFAQAKDSAKNTALLSNIKQTGTSQMIYATDYDDIFSPTMASHPVQPVDLGWQDLVQPYMKNYELVLNPKRTRPANNTFLYWTRLQHMGMPARAATSAVAQVRTQGYLQGTHAGQNVRYEGVGGFVNLDTTLPDWAGRFVASSYSNTQVDDVSNTILIVEGSSFDNWFSMNVGDGVTLDPMRYCLRWNPVPDANANGSEYSAPITTTTRPLNGLNGLVPGCFTPQGRSTATMTDSSARSVDFRGQIYNPSPSKTANVYVSKLLNPMGI